MKALLFCIWLICAIALLNLSLSMVSAANSIENLMGLMLLIALASASICTKCFTIITKLWKKE